MDPIADTGEQNWSLNTSEPMLDWCTRNKVQGEISLGKTKLNRNNYDHYDNYDNCDERYMTWREPSRTDILTKT